MGMRLAARVVRATLALIFLLPPLVLAEPPLNPLPTFDGAKRVARDVIYADQRTDFYCACAFAPTKTGSGGTIDSAECGYTPRKNKARGKVLEWEHVMPADFFGHMRMCWTKGNSECVKADGTAFKGRRCCAKVDKVFKRIEADLHNLTPAVGELNGDRSNLAYGLVTSDAPIREVQLQDWREATCLRAACGGERRRGAYLVLYG
jgi:deoxyribonuclease-1